MRTSLAALLLAAPEIASNGGFDVDAGWTKGTGWTIANGVANRTSQASTSSLTLQNAVPVPGRRYRLSYSIRNYGGGGTLQAGVGATGGANRSANGDYVEYLTAASATTFNFFASATFAADLDNVSIRRG